MKYLLIYYIYKNIIILSYGFLSTAHQSS